ncbi:MAG: hypothetical protein H7A09_01200 [Oceanospirillaceae bacterium]|nr:hypothetical protein [Oceanospirillaceae bacterium]MCP5350225.1 hypothetical protein [Oceanospirillaceae bacterium]
MKLLALLVGLLSPLAHAGVFTTERVQTYPSDWPQLSGMSDTCVEVQGSFVDPNSWRWEREEKGAKYGGTREAAWITFGLPAQDVLSEDPKVKSRTFTISIDSEQSVTVKYAIDENVVASRSFAKGKWSCGKDGLTITTLDRSGGVLDKLPNEGHTIRRSTIYRLNEYVYIKTLYETKARVFYVVPQSFLDVAWFRFAEIPK